MYYKILDREGRPYADRLSLTPHVRAMHRDGTVRCLLVYLVSDIVDKVQDHAYIAGDAAVDSGTEQKVADHLIDVTDEKNKSLIQHSVGLAISECEQQMLFLTKHRPDCHISLDTIDKPNRPEYLIEMRISVDSSDNTVVALQRLIFDYCVARVMRDYCLDAYPSGAERWGAQMDADLEKITVFARTLDKKPPRKPWPTW